MRVLLVPLPNDGKALLDDLYLLRVTDNLLVLSERLGDTREIAGSVKVVEVAHLDPIKYP